MDHHRQTSTALTSSKISQTLTSEVPMDPQMDRRPAMARAMALLDRFLHEAAVEAVVLRAILTLEIDRWDQVLSR